LDTRSLAKHFAEWQEQFLKVLTETQIAANMSPVVEKPGVKEKGHQTREASTPFNKMSHCDDEGISQLVRKQKCVGKLIEVLMHEMHKLVTDEKSQRRLDKALERLNSFEKQYSRIVQELIAILPNEESVNGEVRKWGVISTRNFGNYDVGGATNFHAIGRRKF
jgi:superfamily II helicase